MSNSSTTLLVAVDGGGTGCRAAIGTAADGVLARADGGRANFSTDSELAISNVLSAVHTAASNAGITHSAFSKAVAFVGMAGAVKSRDTARVSQAMPFRHCVVDDDRPASVVGALNGASGWLISAGTGTFIAATDGENFKFIGGWGFYLADEGSGASLGRALLNRILQCYDGLLVHSDFTRAIFARFHNDPNEIVAFSVTARPADYAVFAQDIVAAAQAKDPIAVSLMRDGADYFEKGLAALGFKAGATICFSGSVSAYYADYLSPETLSGRVESKGTALDGAFQLARNAADAYMEVGQ